MAHIGLIYKAHLLIIFFITTLGSISHAGICQFCRQASNEEYKNYNCDKCDAIFEKAKKTVKGENKDYDAKLNMCIPTSPDTVSDCSVVQAAANLDESIISVASKPPFEIESLFLKPAVTMIGSLLSSLKKPSHTISPISQPGINVHFEYPASALVSFAISNAGLQEKYSPIANGMDGLINFGEDINTESNWNSSLNNAVENVDDEIGTLFWLISVNGWIFLSIQPNNGLIMFLWNYCSANGEASHYALIEFDSIDSVRDYLSSLVEEDQCINSGVIRNVFNK